MQETRVPHSEVKYCCINIAQPVSTEFGEKIEVRTACRKVPFKDAVVVVSQHAFHATINPFD